MPPITLFCLVYHDTDAGADEAPLAVKTNDEETLSELKDLIKAKKSPEFENLAANRLKLWKWNKSTDKIEGLNRNNVLDSRKKIRDVFKDDPAQEGRTHIIVKHPLQATITPGSSNVSDLSASSSGKHPRYQKTEEDEALKRIRTGKRQKKWTLDPIHPYMMDFIYFLDPLEQIQSKSILKSVLNGEFVVVTGARSAGKTTRLFRLRNLLENMGFYCFWFTCELLDYSSVDTFWSSIGIELEAATARVRLHLQSKITSASTFNSGFLNEKWDRQVILLIDELNEISTAPDEIKDSFLRTLRGMRQKGDSAIKSIVGAGTFNVIRLTTSKPSLSPFNISNAIQTPYFDLEETQQLFSMFEKEYDICVESAVVHDVWAKSNGHPGMVSLCGGAIAEHLKYLRESGERTVSFKNWQKYSIERLYGQINRCTIFRRMFDSLCDKKARTAMQLYRSHFAGFLEDVEISFEDEALADYLTSEGVLLRPVAAERTYRATSPLIDAVLRLRVIPSQFRDKPLVDIRETEPGIPDIPFVLEQSLKCFDKELIRLAFSCSYKLSKVGVNGSPRTRVPRESVYDTELMRILCNWLLGAGWSVTGQWHMTTNDGKHKYSDIVMQRKNHAPVVLGLLATGDVKFVNELIKKTPEYMALVSAVEGWVIHFTCEDSFTPTWQTSTELACGVNVIHVSHKEDFSNIKLHIYSNDVEKREFELQI